MCLATASQGRSRFSSVIDAEAGVVAGTDCSREDVYISSDQFYDGSNKLNLHFFALAATLNDGVSADRANCSIRIPAEIPAGTRLVIKSAVAEGDSILNDSSVGGLSARIAFLGLDSGIRTLTFNGGHSAGDDTYKRQLIGDPSGRGTLSSACARQDSRGLVQINTALSIKQRPTGRFQISSGVVSLSQLDVHYKLEPCQ
jgi:hypothetical protein